MVEEDDGVLSFEWVLLLTLLVIGVVSGVAGARDAVVDELGDAAQAMIALDQSFVWPNPLMLSVDTDGDGAADPVGGASDAQFIDFANFGDCTRGAFGVPGQIAEVDNDS
jgi:hypothetical protein